MEWALEILKHFRDFCTKWGDVASIIGLPISLIGFWLAIKGITTARQAAQQAAAAAQLAKEKILRQGTLAHFSSATAVMEELIRLHRKKDWGIALDRHAELRRMLVELKDGSVGITSEQQTTIQGTVEQFNSIERQIEKHVSDGKPEPSVGRINDIVKSQIVKVQGIAISLKNS